MNTIPDEVLIALWLDDELHGEEFAEVEAWAHTQPDQLAVREEIRGYRKLMAATLPSEVEPPYPDFFNSRIGKAIREQASVEELPAAVAPAKALSIWRWLFPATAFAGMALAFWVGTKATTGTPSFAKVEDRVSAPVWYTPEQGVDAEWVPAGNNSATVIVLQGVNAIPDALDFSETAHYQNPASIKSTADTTTPSQEKAPQ